jgi:hypothetical protein
VSEFEFRDSCFGIRISGVGFHISGLSFGVSGFVFRVGFAGFRVSRFGSEFQSFGFHVSGLDFIFRVSYFGSEVRSSPRAYRGSAAGAQTPPSSRLDPEREKERFFIDSLLVRTHLSIEMILVDRHCVIGV